MTLEELLVTINIAYNKFPYDFISETFHCFHNHMGLSAKRKFAEIFPTEEERNKALQLVQTCHRRNAKGVQKIELTIEEFAFWNKLIRFCEYVSLRRRNKSCQK